MRANSSQSLLNKNSRIEADLIDNIFSASEWRLAGLLFANYEREPANRAY
jgi:hypothetical protein